MSRSTKRRPYCHTASEGGPFYTLAVIERIMSFRAIVLSLRPNKHQQKRLEETRLICMWLWNYLRDECIAEFMETNSVMSVIDLNALITPLKADHPELWTVYSNVLENISVRVRNSVRGALRRKDEDGAFRFPRSKTPKTFRCFEYTSPKDFTIDSNRISLGKMRDAGGIRFKCSQKIVGDIKRCQIVKRKSHRYAHLIVEVQGEGTEWLEDRRTEVGMDLGLKQLATISDGGVYENIRHDSLMAASIACFNRRMSKLEEGTDEWLKQKRHLNNRYNRLTNLRRNYLCHVAKDMTEKYRFIAMEDIKIKKLLEVEWRSTRRSQYYASWGILEGCLARAADRSGTTVVKVNPRGTTQMCSGCGCIVPKTLSDRVHRCTQCGLVMDRDLNASHNILAAGRAAAVSSRELRESLGDSTTDR